MGHRGAALQFLPVFGVENDLTIAMSVFKFHVAIFSGVFKYLLSDFYVLLAVLHDFFDFAFAPPADGLQAVR